MTNIFDYRFEIAAGFCLRPSLWDWGVTMKSTEESEDAVETRELGFWLGPLHLQFVVYNWA